MVEEIGYGMHVRAKVLYLILFLTMTNNGLREIRYEDDPAAISKFVDFGYHFISLYLDHDVSIRSKIGMMTHFSVANVS
jgi:hypothetical protein